MVLGGRQGQACWIPVGQAPAVSRSGSQGREPRVVTSEGVGGVGDRGRELVVPGRE
ncbi:MAG: hypothetical protein ACRDPF_39735 [Streptosporangiaceae bacterium]